MASIYEELPKLKAEITLTKIFIIIGSIGLFFVLPCVVISEYQKTGNFFLQEGRVAGATSSTVVNFSVQGLDLNSQAGALILGGVLLLGISIVLTIYLLVQNAKTKRKFKY